MTREPDNVEALDRVSRAAEKARRLEPRLEAARKELHAAIRDAHEQGVSVAVLAKVAGISRQRVSVLVRKRP